MSYVTTFLPNSAHSSTGKPATDFCGKFKEYANSLPERLVVAVTMDGYTLKALSSKVLSCLRAKIGCLNSLI